MFTLHLSLQILVYLYPLEVPPSVSLMLLETQSSVLFLIRPRSAMVLFSLFLLF